MAGKPQDPEKRFWTKVNKDGPIPPTRPDLGPCWIWTACKNRTGYGKFGLGYRTILAHRYAYESIVGPVPVGLVLDHLCINPPCVNPHHLEPVTHRINTLRGTNPPAQNARKTVCKHGHPLSGANLVMIKGVRSCNECCRRNWRRTNKRRKAEHTAAILRGDLQTSRKLTPDLVRQIRAMDGIKSRRSIAAEFNVSPATVTYIMTGRLWRHVQ